MYKFKIILVFLLIANQIIGQGSNEVLDSLNFYLFPINTNSELSDTLNNYIQGKNTTLIVGRRNRPNLIKAKSILKQIRQKNNPKDIHKLGEIYKIYENIFKNEWGKAIEEYFDHEEFMFFMEFEKTLYTLNIELLFKKDEEKYNSVKNHY